MRSLVKLFSVCFTKLHSMAKKLTEGQVTTDSGGRWLPLTTTPRRRGDDIELAIHWDRRLVYWRRARPAGTLQATVACGAITMRGVLPMSFLLPASAVARVTVEARDQYNNPARIDGAPTVTASAPDVVAVEVSEAGEITLRPLGVLGVTQIQVTADADLGEGVTQISGVADVEVVAGEAVSLTVGLALV